MKILALEPYYGGSHAAFIDGWIARSRHEWTLLTLPPSKWKWRMRHSAITLSAQVSELAAAGERWDAVFCSDMLNLAEFLGLAPESVRDLPVVSYFHENQLTYPVIHEKEYDYHFAFSNMTTALASTSVWFNTAYHRDSFLDELGVFLKRMPDYRPLEAVEAIRSKSSIRSPGIDPVKKETVASRQNAANGTASQSLHVMWAARWEYDKAPEVFFDACSMLVERGTDFKLSVLGGWSGNKPLQVFIDAEQEFADRILHWGYQDTKDAYNAVLAEADVAVSTANHEFFGIGIVEAAAAGAFPLVPCRLAYPEVFGSAEQDDKHSLFYDGTAEQLADRLCELADAKACNQLWQNDPGRIQRVTEQYEWGQFIQDWDDQLEAMGK